MNRRRETVDVKTTVTRGDERALTNGHPISRYPISLLRNTKHISQWKTNETQRRCFCEQYRQRLRMETEVKTADKLFYLFIYSSTR